LTIGKRLAKGESPNTIGSGCTSTGVRGSSGIVLFSADRGVRDGSKGRDGILDQMLLLLITLSGASGGGLKAPGTVRGDSDTVEKGGGGGGVPSKSPGGTSTSEGGARVCARFKALSRPVLARGEGCVVNVALVLPD